MADGNIGLENVIACPECRGGFEMRPRTFTCYGDGSDSVSVVFDYRDGVANLLPISKGKERYTGDSDDISFTYDASTVKLESGKVRCLLNDISRGAMREVDEHIMKDVIHGLPNGSYETDGRLTNKGVHLVTGLFQELLVHYKDRIFPERILDLAAVVSKARYEAELAASRDYVGNFVMPDYLIEDLPHQRGVLVEFAMGNGANLRELSRKGDYAVSIGFDNCSGMVAAAQNRNSNGLFLAVGDAHHPPLREGVVDTLVMFNALDRLADPQTSLQKLAKSVKPGGLVVFGNCVPLQYKIVSGNFVLDFDPNSERFNNVESAVSSMGASIIKVEREIPWHPETLLQGRENLLVDVAIGRMDD